jgi:mannose-6-phosphate isomerase-like protein (cupin superfamily)
MMLKKVRLSEKFETIDELWRPKTVAKVNEFAVKLVKTDGEFIWHDHPDDDEVFLIVKGSIDMHYLLDGEEHVETFGEGELLKVPRGMQHRPVCAPGTELILIERYELVNTGSAPVSEVYTAPHAEI